jgi:DNA-binding NarL/FixJ family response regulator
MRTLVARDDLPPENITNPLQRRIGVTIYEREPLVRHGLRSLVSGFQRTYVLREIEEPGHSVVIRRNDDPLVNLVGPSFIGRLSALVKPGAPPVVALVTGTSYAEFNEVQRASIRGLVLIDEVGCELEFAIEAVAAGRPFLSAPFIERIMDWLCNGTLCARQPSVTPDLTQRECQVLALLGRGHTNYEIARELKIRDTTVRTHLCHILTKLNLRNRTAAALYASRSDLYGCFV